MQPTLFHLKRSNAIGLLRDRKLLRGRNEFSCRSKVAVTPKGVVCLPHPILSATGYINELVHAQHRSASSNRCRNKFTPLLSRTISLSKPENMHLNTLSIFFFFIVCLAVYGQMTEASRKLPFNGSIFGKRSETPGKSLSIFNLSQFDQHDFIDPNVVLSSECR